MKKKKQEEVNPLEIDNHRYIQVYGVVFHGVEELVRWVNRESKEGVFVSANTEAYPCFDSCDYASEDRSYWNFFFAKDPEELQRKSALVKRTPKEANNERLTAQLVEQVGPVIYWEGDSYHPMITLPCPDFELPEIVEPVKEKKKKEKKVKAMDEQPPFISAMERRMQRLREDNQRS